MDISGLGQVGLYLLADLDRGGEGSRNNPVVQVLCLLNFETVLEGKNAIGVENGFVDFSQIFLILL